MFGTRNFVNSQLESALPSYCGVEEKSQHPSTALTSITHLENPLNPLLLPTSGSISEDKDCSSPLRRTESFHARPSPEKKSEESNPAAPYEEIAEEPIWFSYNSDSDSEEEKVTIIKANPDVSSASPLKGILVKKDVIQAPKKHVTTKVTFSMPLEKGQADAGDEFKSPFTSNIPDDKKLETYDLPPQLFGCQVESIKGEGVEGAEILGSIAQPQTYCEGSYD